MKVFAGGRGHVAVAPPQQLGKKRVRQRSPVTDVVKAGEPSSASQIRYVANAVSVLWHQRIVFRSGGTELSKRRSSPAEFGQPRGRAPRERSQKPSGGIGVQFYASRGREDLHKPSGLGAFSPAGLVGALLVGELFETSAHGFELDPRHLLVKLHRQCVNAWFKLAGPLREPLGC